MPLNVNGTLCTTEEELEAAIADLPDDQKQFARNDFFGASNLVIVEDVTPRQIRQALVLSGVSMEQIETALASLPEPTKTLAKIEWEYSTAFLRSNPLVGQVGLMLGWTNQQLDDLWRFAKGL